MAGETPAFNRPPRPSSPLGVFVSDDSDIVHRRVRNQVMFWLQRVVDIRRDPTPVDLNEVINQWYDWNVEELSDVQLYWRAGLHGQRSAGCR